MCKFSDWSEFKLTHKKSVIFDSLFLRFMNSSITREKRQNVDYCKDFIVVKFQYNTKYKIVDSENNTESQEVQLNKNDIRNKYYKDGVSDGVQCYTPRFAEGDRLAAFRSPHNSPNNIVHLYNVYPERLVKYFSNIGNNVIS